MTRSIVGDARKGAGAVISGAEDRVWGTRMGDASFGAYGATCRLGSPGRSGADAPPLPEAGSRALSRRVVAAAGDGLPVLGDEIQATALAGNLPSGVRQSGQETQNPEVGPLARGLEELEEVGIEGEAQAVRAGDVPGVLAGLDGREACAEGARGLRRHPRALSLMRPVARAPFALVSVG